MKRTIAQADQGILPLNHYLVIYLAVLQDAGVDIKQFEQETGLSENFLKNPNNKLSYLQIRKVIKKGLQLSNDPALALKFGNRLSIVTHGELGQLLQSCSTVKDAVETAIQFISIRIPFASAELTVEGDEAVVDVKVKVPFPMVKHFLSDVLLACVHRVRTDLFHLEDEKTTIFIKQKQTSNVDAYIKIFGNDVHFHQSRNQYRVNADILDRPLPKSDPVAKQIFQQLCESKLEQSVQQEDLISYIETLIFKDDDTIRQLDDIAEYLCVAPRTLRRHLQAFETSYQELLTEVRREKAIEFLKTTDITVEDISYKLGYQDPSNFGNAFRRWMGCSPSAFREQ